MVVLAKMLFNETVDFDELSGRGVRRALRAGYQAVGDYWVTKLLPRHFIRGAGTRYGYKPRSPKYEKKKRAIAAKEPGLVQDGGRVLLVFTARLRDHLLGGAGVRVRSFPTRATVYLTSPGNIPFRPRRPNYPNIGQELTAISDDEVPLLQAQASRAAAAEIRSMRRRKRTTFGG